MMATISLERDWEVSTNWQKALGLTVDSSDKPNPDSECAFSSRKGRFNGHPRSANYIQGHVERPHLPRKVEQQFVVGIRIYTNSKMWLFACAAPGMQLLTDPHNQH